MRCNQRKTLSVCLFLTLFVFLSGISPGMAGTDVEAEYVKSARGKIKEFAQELMGEFKSALGKGGPVEAISGCSDKAYALANKISRQTGWMVRRVSLKTRNPMDRPDSYETKILHRFQSVPKGEKTTGQVFEIVDTGGRKEFRYMKVIRLAPPCLKCHGPLDQIPPEVKARLDTYYPHDQATGYKAGDVRGAFSVRIPLN